METTLFSPPNTSDPRWIPLHYSSDVSNDPGMFDLCFDDPSFLDLANFDDDEDAVISPQGSERPSKSPGPDPATTLLQSSRRSVTQDQSTNLVDPPNFMDDGDLSSPPANAPLGPVQTSEGHAEEIPTVSGNEGNSKPCAPESVTIDRLEPTRDSVEASQPAAELHTPLVPPIPTPLQHQPAAPSTTADTDQSTCRPISTAQHRHAGKRAHDSDKRPATPAYHSPSHAAPPANKKRKQSRGEPVVIDLTGDDDDPDPEDDSRGWRRLTLRLQQLAVRTDNGEQRYVWKRRSKVWESLDGGHDRKSIDFKSVVWIVTRPGNGYLSRFTLSERTRCFEGSYGEDDEVSVHSAEVAVMLRNRDSQLIGYIRRRVSHG